MHQHFWGDDETRREAAHKLEATLRARAKARAEGTIHPPSFELDVPHTSALTVKFVGVLLDAREYDDLAPLMREAKALHHRETGSDEPLAEF